MTDELIRVLLVEDEPASARLLQRMLCEVGDNRFEVEWVETLGAGLERIKASSFHVVLLDLKLPDSTGVETVERFRRVEKDLPVIVVSGLGDDAAILGAMQRGAQDYLAKGYLVPELLRRSIIYTVERRRAETAQEGEHRLLFTVMDSIPDRVYVKDADGRFTMVNKAAAAAFGMDSLHEVLGKTASDFFTEECADRILTDEQEVMRTGQPVIGREERETWVDGRETWASTTKVPLCDNHGEIIGTCGVSRDITERVRRQEEAKKLDEQIQQAERIESLSVMAGGIAHDFNNLLMAIIGNADLAAIDLDGDSSLNKHIDEIKSAALRAAELCNQMLSFAGKGRFVFQPIDLSRLARDMSELIRASVPRKIVIEYDMIPESLSIEGDTSQIQQLIMSLVTNAAEAIGDDEGVISVSSGVREYDEVALRDVISDEKLLPGRYAFLTVSDTGCGMDAETRKRMINPFFTTKFAGRGMGLPAVLGIMRGHGGGLDVVSGHDHGSALSVLFPCSGMYPKTESRLRRVAGEMGGGTVLVVDDEELVLNLAISMIEHMGFAAISARDGIEAVEVFREHADEISLVLLDLTMPRLNGEEAFDEIRRIKADALVIISSGYTRENLMARFRGKGVVGFMHKPYELNTLRTKLCEVMNGTKGTKS